jgi:hypothetical protein
MTVLTTSAVPGEVSPSQEFRPAANMLMRRCAFAMILITLGAFSLVVAVCLISVFAHGEQYVGEIDDVLIALVFCAIAAVLKIIEKFLRAREDLRRHC